MKKLILIVLFSGIVYPADYIPQGQPAPYGGILITEESGQKILEMQIDLETEKGRTAILEKQIEVYQEKGSATDIVITALKLEKENFKALLEAQKAKHRWCWFKQIGCIIVGMGAGYVLGIVK